MSSPPLLLPQVRVDEAELRAALHSVAIPGWTGTLYVEIGLREETEAGQQRLSVVFAVRKREAKRVNSAEGNSIQILPDVERRKPMERVLSAIRPKLLVQPVLKGLEVFVKDGCFQDNFHIQE